MALTPPPVAPPAAPPMPGEAPSRANPTTFRALADAFVVWQVGFRDWLAGLITWLASYISWASTNVTEMDALQTDVTSKSSAATTAASSAATSAASVQANRTALDNRLYPGTYSADPVTRPDGSAVQAGDRYFNTSIARQKTYSGTLWATDNLDAAALAAPGGSLLVGWARAALLERITSDGQMLSAQRLNVWEFADHVTVRPTSDPSTWHWSAAINAALTYAAAHGYEQAYMPPGTYLLEATVAIPAFVGLVGAGFGTKLSPVSGGYRAITVPGGVTASTEGANAHGLIADFLLDGLNVGTDGMWLEIIAYRSFARIKIRNFTGNGLELNDSQNSDFQQVEIRGCGINLLLSHGCGSNDFIKCQFTGAVTADVKFTGLGGDPLRQFTNPTFNTFRNCILEPLNLNKNTTGLVMLEGTNNAFYDCQFVNGKTSKAAISNPVVNTKFINCMFFGLSGFTDCAIDNSGFRTVLIDPYFLNLGDNEVVKARNTTLVSRPTYSSTAYFITNFTANQDTLRIDNGSLLHGTTAQRPASPGITITSFYDTTLGKPIWWAGSSWKDATGAVV